MANNGARWIDGRPVLSVDDLGQYEHITEWLALGPYRFQWPGRFTRDLNIGAADVVNDDPIGVERTVRPVLGMRHDNPDVPNGYSEWIQLSGSTHYDLKKRFSGQDTALAWAVTYLTASKPTDIVIQTPEWFDRRRCLVQTMLDGVTVNAGDEPFLLRLDPGEHVLMLKIAGGESGNVTWHVDAAIGRPVAMDDGLGVALVRASGYWRGDEQAPRPEIDLALTNSGDTQKTLGKICVVSPNDECGPEVVDVEVGPCSVVPLRLSAPLGDMEPASRHAFRIQCGGNSILVDIDVPQLPDPGIIHVVEGFHCDPVWVSDQHHYNLVSLENVRQLLDGCLANPAYRCFLHEIDYLKPFIDEYPDYRAAMFGLIQRGQVGLGSSYNQPNENNCSGEGIIRNLLYGDGFHRHFLGGEPLVYHAWDVFGHVPQLSQILAKSGRIGVIWSKHIWGFPPIFNHVSPDGTALPHIRTPYGWGSHSIDRLRESVQPLVSEKHTYGLRRHLVMDSGDFQSPSSWMIGRTEEMADSFPTVIMSTPEAYLQGHIDDGAEFPITSRNPCQYHIGTQHSRSELKIANRLAENLLYSAEMWSTFAAFMGAKYPDLAIDKAWRQVLFGQHHDALTGTPCDVSYLDLMNGYREALELARSVNETAKQYIASHVKPFEPGESFVVFNPLNWKRDGFVRLPKADGAYTVRVLTEDGSVLPSLVESDDIAVLAQDVPGVGYTTLRVEPSDESAISTVEMNDGIQVIENEYWRIELDPKRGGGISSLLDKASGHELIDAGVGVGNDLAALREKHTRHEPSWEFWTTGERCFASDGSANVTVERSSVGQTATIEGRIGDIADYCRTITVRRGQRHIEANVVIDGYRGEDDLFAVTTPVAVSGALPVFEDRFCSVVARRGCRKFDYRSSGPTVFSDAAVYPVHNWVSAGWSARIDVAGQSSLNLGSNGVVLPHDDQTEESIVPLIKALNRSGITSTPYYDDDDAERIESLRKRFPEYTQWENTMKRRIDDISMCAQWLVIDVNDNNRYATDLLGRLPSTVLERLQTERESSGWGLVIVEDEQIPEGWPAIPVVILSARDHDALQAAINSISEDLDSDNRIEIDRGCDFRSKPEAVDDYGFAMLTSGTGAASFEPDGTLTLFLTHTSNWSESHLSKRLVPEHRKMIHRYAFYPHAGSWQKSDVVRAGYEFSHPLTAAKATGRSSQLPREQSFLQFDSGEAVITAIKPASNPVARFESAPSDPKLSGVIVRAYDPTGHGVRGKLSLTRPIVEAFSSTLMENDRGEIKTNDACIDWSVGPFSIETVRLVSDGDTWPSLSQAELGVSAEPVQPVWCRYWKHNVGAHPLGYLPVAILLDGKLPIENEGGNFPTVARVRVTINNNLTDRSISGSAQITAPANWSILPRTIPYDLAPREHVVEDVTITFDRPPRTGLLKAQLAHEGQVYQDVIEAGVDNQVVIGGGGGERLNRMDIIQERAVQWSVLRDGNDIVVHVKNPWREQLDAELSIITPLEMWGKDAAAFELADISPRTIGLNIPALQQGVARFKLQCTDARQPLFWAWAKIMYHGKPDYQPVPGTTA